MKISIGSELGEKAGIGHEYAAAHFHRITSDAKISFKVVYSFSTSSMFNTGDANIFNSFLIITASKGLVPVRIHITDWMSACRQTTHPRKINKCPILEAGSSKLDHPEESEAASD